MKFNLDIGVEAKCFPIQCLRKTAGPIQTKQSDVVLIVYGDSRIYSEGEVTLTTATVKAKVSLQLKTSPQ